MKYEVTVLRVVTEDWWIEADTPKRAAAMVYQGEGQRIGGRTPYHTIASVKPCLDAIEAEEPDEN